MKRTDNDDDDDDDDSTSQEFETVNKALDQLLRIWLQLAVQGIVDSRL